MPSLRSLLSNIAPPSNAPQKTFYVYYADHYISQASGANCVWTVPDGVTSVTFELWGGGGGGPAARCCSGPISNGGGGGYAIRTIETTPGCQYTICAGASSCLSAACLGCSGYPSYVTGSGIATTCASGGTGGKMCCFASSMWTCCGSIPSGSTNQGDFTMVGTNGAILADGCFYSHTQVPGSPAGNGIFNRGRNWIAAWRSNGDNQGKPTFPGGGGMGGYDCCCYLCSCGGWGAGGLVKVTYS